MIVEKQFREQLVNTKCYKCGMSLKEARVTPINVLPKALIAHTVCNNCLSEGIITITLAGSGAMPIASDLNSSEMLKFIGAKPTAYEELLDLHKSLKKQSIWKLLQQKEKSLEKRISH